VRLLHSIFASIAILAAYGARAQERSSLDDVARFLAGAVPSPASPLQSLAHKPDWRTTAASFNAAWSGLDHDEIPQIKEWSAHHLSRLPKIVFYLFSGPDFVYVDAFFPNASTYVLAGLEPVGEIPDILTLSEEVRTQGLACVRAPFSHFQDYGIFITAELRAAGKNCELKGTLPLLLVALVHAGKTISSVHFLNIAANGVVLSDEMQSLTGGISGVKIEFADKDHGVRSLYYFNANLSDAGDAAKGFLNFCAELGNGASFLKGASYLLHGANFAQTRNFLLEHSTMIVEDDSGIPLKYLSPDRWLRIPFGDYQTPVSPFQSYFQPDLRALFQSGHPSPLGFGLGYRWRAQELNLPLAVHIR
jgi:hypothetical protein